MIVVKNLSKRYGKKYVLNQIDFEVENQVIGLLGPNGAGKTTLLRILAGLIESDNAEVSITNSRGENANLRNYEIGYLPQNFGLIKNYTLYEHMQYFACMKDIPKHRWKMEIRRVLEMVNLEAVSDIKCGKLSGGMMRRAGIAQAFLGEPQLILLDEPTTGLDPEERLRFQNAINSIKGKCPIIISTHIINDVNNVCSDLMVLNSGNLLYMGEVGNIAELAQGRVFKMTRIESMHWQEYGMNIRNEHDRDGNEIVRFLYLGDKPYTNVNAQPLVADVEDGYMYLLKYQAKDEKLNG